MPDSSSVGTSLKASCGERSSPDTASMRRSPDSTCPLNSAGPEKPASIFSPSRALVSGPPQSYEM